jgi:hypothetical protein
MGAGGRRGGGRRRSGGRRGREEREDGNIQSAFLGLGFESVRERVIGYALLVIQDDAFSRSKHELQVFDHVCSFLRNVFRQIVKPTTFQK